MITESTGSTLDVEASPGRAALALAYAPIADELTEATRLFDAELAGDLPFVGELCDTVRAYRGKMLRPALLLLSGRAVGRVTPAHSTLAAVVEMVHVATLVHDDVLDGAGLRRGRPTIANLSGNQAAVLLGDYLISHAFHLCSSLDSQYASRRIGAATNVVCEGELLQNLHSGRADVTEGEYLELVRRKTGALTAVACELGARFAGADEALTTDLATYGLASGTAFQVVDDVLDLVGSEGEVGKTLGTDFAGGKATLPVIHCLTRGPAELARRVRATLSNGPADGRHLREWLTESGSIDYALSIAEGLVAEAVARLERLKASEAKASLKSLAEFILRRRF